MRNNTEDGTVKQIKGNWTPEEDMILKKKVADFGLKKWKEIATFLPGRIGKQCRERWYNNVDPNLNKEKWTIQNLKIRIVTRVALLVHTLKILQQMKTPPLLAEELA